jgi:hypothetical protein
MRTILLFLVVADVRGRMKTKGRKKAGTIEMMEKNVKNRINFGDDKSTRGR